MVLGRLTDAVADLKETLRRVFLDPPSHSVDPGGLAVSAKGVPALAAKPVFPPFRPEVDSFATALEMNPSLEVAPMIFRGQVQAEAGWAQWAAGARVCEMTRFGVGAQRRMEVPPLPRRTPCKRLELEAFRAGVRGYRSDLNRPVVRGGSPELGSILVHGGLEQVLGLPIAMQGQAVQDIPKILWMRYSLQLVKATGENIRNLDVLGLYRIPAKGVVSMRHDAKSGRLLLELGREAAGASRQPFILARRKDDRTLVSCFLEEG